MSELQEVIIEPDQKYFSNVSELEGYMRDEYGCFLTYNFDPTREANEVMFWTNQCKKVESCSLTWPGIEDLHMIHNKNRINIYFPNCGFRVTTTKFAIENIPYIDNIINGDFKKDNVTKYLYKKDEKCVETATNFIMLDNPEMLLFRNPYNVVIKNWKPRCYYDIINIEPK